MHANRMFTYLAVAVAVALVLGVAGVRLAALLPFAVLLACPLMMIFMMRGMRGMRRGGENQNGYGREHGPTGNVEPPANRPS